MAFRQDASLVDRIVKGTDQQVLPDGGSYNKPIFQYIGCRLSRQRFIIILVFWHTCEYTINASQTVFRTL
jgi:hypothetical protein